MSKKSQDDDERPKAPDGGWGWFACLGSSFITLSLRSLEPSFGLIFHDLLIDLKIDSTRMSTFPSVFDACSNFSGIFVGPLLNKFSYRKVAVFGSLLCCTGLTLTAFAKSATHIILTYSILNGIGNGLALASAFIALNTYFDKKRGQATEMKSQVSDETELPLMEKTLNESPSKLDSKPENECLTFLKSFTDIFNLDLLKNFSYLNVIFGLSLFAVSEVNFKLVTPFFLRNTIGIP
ncbi:hypothetical protein G9C98_006186 [Cotesia typhae]|uniref:Uncharacterized protein n=1 Tax=Cotesia typhae TaxID=2053667 RepID=A0A8J5UV30_9HYME|nr:hypothetical protein G9C98_006186 [Cotesia typhae]